MKKFITLLIVTILGTAAFSGQTRNATAVKLKGKINLDGKLDEAAWQQAPVSPPLVELKGGGKVNKKLQTTFKVLYDDKGVYFGIKSLEPEIKKLKTNAPLVLDSAVWINDDVEVFIDPIGDRVEYYQFGTTPGGAKCDFYYIEGGNTGKSGYNPVWQSKSFVGSNYYTTEIFIPFAALNVRKLKPGKQDWIISVARQRLAGGKSRHTLFNTGGKRGFHNVTAWGKVQGITVPSGKYQLYGENPSAEVGRTASGYNVTTAINLLNRGNNARKVTVQAEIAGKKVKKSITLPKGKLHSVELPAMNIASQGITQVNFSVIEPGTGKLLYTNIAVIKLKYQPILLRITQPAYRNSIYFTQKVNKVSADVTLNMPQSKLSKAKLVALFQSSKGKRIWSKDYKVTAGSNKLSLTIPAATLPVGNYQLQIKLRGSSGSELAKTSTDVFKLGNAPGVEVRIDRKGNTVINGVPLFIRGWYGNYIYKLAPVSMAGVRLPRSVNFLMGGGNVDSTRLGFKYTVGLSRIPGLEEAAKAGKKLPKATKQAVLEKIAAVKYDRNAIGYYLSDEPECRGLSAETLQELYQLIKKADPYRLCLIVSRAPAQYWQACDVISPHPYNNPIINQQGKRAFSQDYADIHRKLQEGYKAINGRAKGLWSMPQIFSYYEFGAQSRSVQPDFSQARWSIYSGVANHATGVVPFIFCDYWNDIENRIGVNYMFETLAWLEPAWTEGNDQKTLVRCSNGGAIDVVTKKYNSKGQSHLYIVATNRTDKKTKVNFTIFGANRYKRLFVLRENRSITFKRGKFNDSFAAGDVHIYTTCDQIPYFKSLKQIKREIAAIKSYSKSGKNILRNGKINWQRGVSGRDSRIYGDSLADGNFDSLGWHSWYGNRKELNLVFPDSAKFSKFSFYSNNIKTARLEVWSFGKWRELAKWTDIHQFKTTWQGKMQDTVKLRLLVDKVKLGRNVNGSSIPCITEIEME
jgi:Carbohydrate family 9 binding domain-like